MQRILLSLCFIPFASLALAADEHDASESTSISPQIVLTSQSTTYTTRDNIDLTLWSNGSAYINPQISVSGPDGRPVAHHGIPVQTASLAEQLTQTPSSPGGETQGPTAILAIPDLKKLYTINRSGTYAVSFSAMEADSSGKLVVVRSDSLTIHVINETLHPVHEISLDAVRWWDNPEKVPDTDTLVVEGRSPAKTSEKFMLEDYSLSQMITHVALIALPQSLATRFRSVQFRAT